MGNIDNINKTMTTVSVVIPCVNEVNTIRHCIESVTSSSGNNIKLEIVVVDGGSDDGTLEILSELQKNYNSLKVIQNKRKITPIGLNKGITASSGEFILILGAHTTVSRDYIETLVKDLRNDPSAGYAGGVIVSMSDNTLFQQLAGAVGESRFGVGNSYFRVGVESKVYVDTVAYGLYRREVLDAVGLFDERLVRNQDIELSHRIRSHGYTIILDPDVSAYYYPRSSLREFIRQSFSNGYWNIITHRLIPGSLSTRHFVPLAAVVVGIVLFLLSFASVRARQILTFLMVLYFALDMFESASIAYRRQAPRLLLCLFVFPLLHISYGVGSLWSIFSAFNHKSRSIRGAE